MHDSKVYGTHTSMDIAEHIEAKAKLPPFRRRHFQMHFFNEIVWNSLQILDSLKCVPKVWINNM